MPFVPYVTESMKTLFLFTSLNLNLCLHECTSHTYTFTHKKTYKMQLPSNYFDIFLYCKECLISSL